MTDANDRGDPTNKLREAAILVALRTGLLKKCPIHSEVYDPGQHDYQGAVMVATYLVNQSAPLVAPFDGDRAPLIELLKSICHSHATSCPGCARPVDDPTVCRGVEAQAGREPAGDRLK